jgi:plasmid stability protein
VRITVRVAKVSDPFSVRAGGDGLVKDGFYPIGFVVRARNRAVDFAKNRPKVSDSQIPREKIPESTPRPSDAIILYAQSRLGAAMGQLIVRNLDERVVDALKARAARQARSLEAELRVILERAAAERVFDLSEARARADAIRASLEGQEHSDSAAMIREDPGR